MPWPAMDDMSTAFGRLRPKEPALQCIQHRKHNTQMTQSHVQFLDQIYDEEQREVKTLKLCKYHPYNACCEKYGIQPLASSLHP